MSNSTNSVSWSPVYKWIRICVKYIKILWKISHSSFRLVNAAHLGCKSTHKANLVPPCSIDATALMGPRNCDPVSPLCYQTPWILHPFTHWLCPGKITSSEGNTPSLLPGKYHVIPQPFDFHFNPLHSHSHLITRISSCQFLSSFSNILPSPPLLPIHHFLQSKD